MSDARALLAERCANHENREAVCRCPECRRSLCRECVDEHEGRLICAQCLRRSARATGPRRRRGVAEAAAAVAGLLLAWTIFFAAGESLVTITERSERVAWQDR